MGILGSVLDRLRTRKAGTQHPPPPKPNERYVLVTGDMLAFDLLDGEDDCGGVQLRDDSEGDPTPWMVHVYGIDLNFPSFRKARAWLGNPEVRVQS